eukprot:TRINITY_DN6595_c0_g1_i11.p1 TRINITY_DN6595_c0_g1~~TRINITY_DN6595_c0_g1_i11.p1  ORF type:complete len:347 (-),score=52.28 TRINITY_DN6595_c0_g1_i11:261-1301(-)
MLVSREGGRLLAAAAIVSSVGLGRVSARCTFCTLTSQRQNWLSFVGALFPCVASPSPVCLQFASMHEKARCTVYPLRADQIERIKVPDDKVEWSTEWADYSPTEFTAPFVLKAPWADPELNNPEFEPKWNSLDGKVNRVSYEPKKYDIDAKGKPLNPCGRTGLCGRGILGRWGPNHAADPVVTRWQRDSNGDKVVNTDTGLPILEFVCIERGDGGGWAIPGGMVDPGEKVAVTLKREFMEEAMDSTQASKEENAQNSKLVDSFFSAGGTEVYKGYVDDPRNTDNAWMETVVMNFHDESGNKVGNLKLKAGDDAKNLKWMAIGKSLTLYASHKSFVEKVAKLQKAHW